ncbi:MAG: FHA domain-containing protein [Deltaproteobacteria bacterium]|nr:FHA domain-containing protein [Deltaproteobacteria bacterium]
MAQIFVQDYIRACMEMEKAVFSQQYEAPVLIYEHPRAGLSFNWGQTRLTAETKQVPLTRDLIRNGHKLPVIALCKRVMGPPGQVRLGRSDENDLVIPDETVSSRHAVFQEHRETGTYMLQDLASMNGTQVNGSRMIVGKTVVLFDGDVLAFGDSVFLFFYPDGLYDVLKANLDFL